MDTSGDDTERAFLQARLVLFTATILVLYGFAFVAALAAFALMPEMAPAHARTVHVIAGIGIAALLAGHLVMRARPQSFPRLRFFDTAFMCSSGAMIGGAAWIGCEMPAHVFVPFTLTVLLVFARVFIVPSSARRTAALSFVCMMPVTFANIAVGARAGAMLGVPVPAWAAGGIVLGGAAIALSVVGTRVIYGLRREVREARRYGQYTLEHKLGEGGMGVVFRARHALLRRPTAIKLLPPHKASPEDVARFEREVQLTSELTHPNTIAIYDYGRSTDGVFYYVMEYLDGIDLESLVERDGALPPARVVDIVVQMCNALEEAHARGVIHRDIKPANVLLCRRGQVADFVKVVDFGLVKELARDSTVSAPGAIAGTPAYLAPEAITDPDAVGPASDLYAVGATAYFLLTGKMLFEGKTIIAIINDHLNTAPVPPSKRSGRDIPPALEAIVLRCLAKKPGERPESARALADALSALAITGFTKRDAEAWWARFEGKPIARDDVPAIEAATTMAVLPR
jgi:hypothetical protein